MVTNTTVFQLSSDGGSSAITDSSFTATTTDISLDITWEFNASNDEWGAVGGGSAQSGHGLSVGDAVVFVEVGTGPTSEFSINTPYYVVDAASADIQLSTGYGGSAITSSSSSSGTWRLRKYEPKYWYVNDVPSDTTLKLATTTYSQYPTSGIDSSGNWSAEYYDDKYSTSIGGSWTFDNLEGGSDGGIKPNMWVSTHNHGLSVGDKIQFVSSGGGATNYSTGTTYYVIDVLDVTKIRLSSSGTGSVVSGGSNSSGFWKMKRIISYAEYNVKTVPSTTSLTLSISRDSDTLEGTSDSSGNWAAEQVNDIELRNKNSNTIGGNWTFDSTGGASEDLWTTDEYHNLCPNDKIIFTASGGGASYYSTDIIYYVKTVISSTTLTLSDGFNGRVVRGSSDSSGNWKAKKITDICVKNDSIYMQSSYSCFALGYNYDNCVLGPGLTNAAIKQINIDKMGSVIVTTIKIDLTGLGGGVYSGSAKKMAITSYNNNEPYPKVIY